MTSPKNILYTLCYERIEQRIESIRKTIRSARESSAEETKSSAGDKYETGRAMIQQEIDKSEAVLSDLLKQKNILDTINPDHTTIKVMRGSMVETSNGNFFIAISGGQHTINGELHYIISDASPIGKHLMNKNEGDEFTFNEKLYRIERIY